MILDEDEMFVHDRFHLEIHDSTVVSEMKLHVGVFTFQAGKTKVANRMDAAHRHDYRDDHAFRTPVGSLVYQVRLCSTSHQCSFHATCAGCPLILIWASRKAERGYTLEE